MRKITDNKAKQIAAEYNINLSVVPLNELTTGINIEREHIPFLELYLSDELMLDAIVNIALAHLEEDPRYYKYLEAQEVKREAYWSKRSKPSIYTKK